MNGLLLKWFCVNLNYSGSLQLLLLHKVSYSKLFKKIETFLAVQISYQLLEAKY